MRRSLAMAICALSCAATRAFAVGAEYAPPVELPVQAELPDPLVMSSGDRVTTPEQWHSQRAPELRGLFEHYMYGRLPAAPERIVGRTLFEDAKAFGGKGTLREVELTFGPPEWPKIYLLIASPNARPGGEKAPACFVGANFGGNHLRGSDGRVRLPTAWMPPNMLGVVDNRATEAGRGKQAESWDLWPLEQAVDRGYAIATFYCGDIQPDRPDVREGMRATMPEALAGDPTATGAIMWWAWGIHRAVDYLVTDPHVDGKRIAVVGHSRLGKTALLAGALDERIALTIAHQAGCGGSGPSRHRDPRAETVAVITDKFPHWFGGHFATFGGMTERLPLDQNCLVALCAPRPVLFTAAAGDEWANPAGQFEVLRSATQVYHLLGVDGLGATTMPAAGDSLVASRLGYWIRPGEHALEMADWETFWAFADLWLK